jgi:hypothetical protein
MHPPLRVEVPDEERAERLRLELQPLWAETVRVGGHYEVFIDLVDHNPESRVVAALSRIDTWLASAGLLSVRVHLDGTSYLLHPPPLTLP